MGHRALVGKTKGDGSIEVYYSHWGATNAYSDPHLTEPQEPKEKRYTVKDVKAFVKEIDFLQHEAIWLDGDCYKPVWFGKDGTTGILVEVTNNRDFNRFCQIEKSLNLIDELRPDLTKKQRNKLKINQVIGATSGSEIPEFSPLGYGVKYQLINEILSTTEAKK